MTTNQWSETLSGILKNAGATQVNAQKLALNISNGTHQHIFSLGTFGFVICNHVDKKILLTDPWPTHYSAWIDAPSCKPRVLERKDDAMLANTPEERNAILRSNRAKARISSLASFLRCAVEQEYELSGILLSHMHFDHTDDVALLLELLIAARDPNNNGGDDGYFTDAQDIYLDHLNRAFKLKGNPVPLKKLPKLVADFDSICFIQLAAFGAPLTNLFQNTEVNQTAYFKHNQKLKLAAQKKRSALPPNTKPHYVRWHQLRERYCCALSAEPLKNVAWLEVSDKENHRVIYDDSYGARKKGAAQTQAGKILKPFGLGKFKIQPYTYDHINVGFGRTAKNRLDDQNSGDLQRISAFWVRADFDPEKRSTLFIGSCGEMNVRWTGDVNQKLFIETDMLVYAAFRRKPAEVSSKILDALADRFFLNFSAQVEEGIRYLVRHVQVNEAVVFAHFEEFMTKLRNTAGYRKDLKEAIPFILKQIEKQKEFLLQNGDAAQVKRAQRWQQLSDDNRFYVLARRGTGFEAAVPKSPKSFQKETNIHV